MSPMEYLQQFIHDDVLGTCFKKATFCSELFPLGTLKIK